MLSLVIWLLVILNPLSTIPAYLAMHPHAKHKQIVKDASVVALWVCMILAVAALWGQAILHAFWLEIEYFRIAGGLVIAWVAWSMAQGKMSVITVSQHPLNTHKDRKEDRGLMIPLVMPMTAGPWSIAFVISQASDAHIVILLWAIVICSIIVYLVIRYGALLLDKLGDWGINLMTRIIGIILLWLSLQIIISTLISLTRW